MPLGWNGKRKEKTEAEMKVCRPFKVNNIFEGRFLDRKKGKMILSTFGSRVDDLFPLPPSPPPAATCKEEKREPPKRGLFDCWNGRGEKDATSAQLDPPLFFPILLLPHTPSKFSPHAPSKKGGGYVSGGEPIFLYVRESEKYAGSSEEKEFNERTSSPSTCRKLIPPSHLTRFPFLFFRVINRVLLQKPPHTNEKGKKIEGERKTFMSRKEKREEEGNESQRQEEEQRGEGGGGQVGEAEAEAAGQPEVESSGFPQIKK